jgi:perosamine synthetase
MKPSIPMSAAHIDESDIQAVLSVLRSGRLALGPATDAFESAMANYVGTRHAIAVNSGTAALHLIVKALEIGEGDEVLVPSFTFAASVNVLLYERAVPVFVDIEPETYNLDPDDLRRKITPRTRAILAVDVFGHPCEWDAILAFAREHGLKVIDDSCEALGSEYRGQKIGQFGDAAAFAFYPNKQMTTGEGGMIVTDDDEIADLCRSLRNQGRGEMGPWLEHERLGFNYRMDEMSGALGLSQLRRIEEFIARREHVANLYNARLDGVDWLRAPAVKSHVRMSWFVYVITLAEGIDRAAVARAAELRGVPVRAYFSPVHLQRYIINRLGHSKGLALTESIARRTLAIPFHNQLTVAQIEEVVDTLQTSVNHLAGRASA